MFWTFLFLFTWMKILSSFLEFFENLSKINLLAWLLFLLLLGWNLDCWDRSDNTLETQNWISGKTDGNCEMQQTIIERRIYFEINQKNTYFVPTSSKCSSFLRKSSFLRTFLCKLVRFYENIRLPVVPFSAQHPSDSHFFPSIDIHREATTAQRRTVFDFELVVIELVFPLSIRPPFAVNDGKYFKSAKIFPFQKIFSFLHWWKTHSLFI